MLVFSRKQNEAIDIGDDIVITVLEIRRGQVRLGFEAPPDVLILRDKVDDDGRRPSKP